MGRLAETLFKIATVVDGEDLELHRSFRGGDDPLDLRDSELSGQDDPLDAQGRVECHGPGIRAGAQAAQVEICSKALCLEMHEEGQVTHDQAVYAEFARELFGEPGHVSQASLGVEGAVQGDVDRSIGVVGLGYDRLQVFPRGEVRPLWASPVQPPGPAEVLFPLGRAHAAVEFIGPALEEHLEFGNGAYGGYDFHSLFSSCAGNPYSLSLEGEG